MKVIDSSRVFGNSARTRALMLLVLLGDSYPREMSRVLELPLSAVQRALQGLERDGLVAARSVGRTRQFQLEPRYFAAVELSRYLLRLVEADDGLRERVARLRRRPRRTGKPL